MRRHDFTTAKARVSHLGGARVRYKEGERRFAEVLGCETLDYIWELERPRRGKFFVWILREVAAHPELGRRNFIGTLSDFADEWQKRRPSLDIYRFTYDEALKALRERRATRRLPTVGSGSKVILEEEDFVVVFVEKKLASCILGRGTKWCISARENNLWASYEGDGGRVYFVLHRRLPTSDPLYKLAVMVRVRDSFALTWTIANNAFTWNTPQFLQVVREQPLKPFTEADIERIESACRADARARPAPMTHKVKLDNERLTQELRPWLRGSDGSQASQRFLFEKLVPFTERLIQHVTNLAALHAEAPEAVLDILESDETLFCVAALFSEVPRRILTADARIARVITLQASYSRLPSTIEELLFIALKTMTVSPRNVFISERRGFHFSRQFIRSRLPRTVKLADKFTQENSLMKYPLTTRVVLAGLCAGAATADPSPDGDSFDTHIDTFCEELLGPSTKFARILFFQSLFSEYEAQKQARFLDEAHPEQMLSEPQRRIFIQVVVPTLVHAASAFPADDYFTDERVEALESLVKHAARIQKGNT